MKKNFFKGFSSKLLVSLLILVLLIPNLGYLGTSVYVDASEGIVTTTEEISDYEVAKDLKADKSESEKYSIEDYSDPSVTQLTLSEDGTIYYGDIPFYVTVGSDYIPARLSDLMEKGVKQKMVALTPLERVAKGISKLVTPTVVNASSGLTVEFQEKISYGLSTVAKFEIDGGKLAFCIEHDDDTPIKGMPMSAPKVYDNAKIQRALYYGWGGPESIFGSSKKNEARGYVVTSLLLSRLYTGKDAGGKSITGYDKLWKIANDSSIKVNTDRTFSDSSLSVSIKNGKQVSETTTYEGPPSDNLTISLPKGLNLVNETKRKTYWGGNKATVTSGDKFHLEASLTYTNDYNSGNLRGQVEEFAAIIAIPKNPVYQTLGYGKAVKDPDNTASFSANFYARSVNMTVEHIDRDGNKLIKRDDPKKVTIGSKYKACPKDFTHNKIAYYADGDCKSGTVGSKDFTVKVYYKQKYKLTVEYYDNNNKKTLQTVDGGSYKWGTDYSHTAPESFNKSNTIYKINGKRTHKGTMPKNNLTIKVPYDPYQKIKVEWKNKYPNHDLLKKDESTQKVGFQFNYTQPKTFTTKDGRIFDRINDDVFSGTLGYKDESHTFYYVLRRTITVNYLDYRTGEVIATKKEYTLNQGDKFSEKHIDIVDSDTGRQYEYVGVEAPHGESGTVGTSNITINYYYKLPLMELGLDKMQVYTAEATEGLPVRIKISKDYFYDKNIPDMKKEKVTFRVSKTGSESSPIDSVTYNLSELPDEFILEIDSSNLSKNLVVSYSTEMVDYDAKEIVIEDVNKKLTTNGHTSAEETVDFTVSGEQAHASKSYVIMTEVTPTTPMREYKETITYKATAIGKQKSGYGVLPNLEVQYEADLGNDFTIFSKREDATANFYIPTDLVDSFIDYDVNGDKATVPLVDSQTKDEKSTYIKNTTTFKGGKVFVEKQTGYLFSEQQVANNDERITNEVKETEGQVFSPIWVELGNYAVNYTTSKLGVNRVVFNVNDNWDIYAQMLGTTDSETIEQDEILFVPINPNNPFSYGVPDNWTEEDLEWLKYED